MSQKSSLSRKSDWPTIRANLERKLETVVRRFVTEGSYDRDALRALAKEVSALNRELDHLDSVECKHREISVKP
jgi:hypothetical protein